MKVIYSFIIGVYLTFITLMPVAAASESGVYVGASLGQSSDDILSETSSALKIFAGYKASANIAVEFAFVDLGEFAVFGVPDVLEQYGAGGWVLGIVPVSQELDIFAKIGLFNWSVDVLGVEVDSGTDVAYGFGGAYTLGKRFSIRGEWENYTEISGGDVSLFSVGVSYTF